MEDFNYHFGIHNKNSKCNIGKHRFRENKFGIVWCIDCGLLGKPTQDSKLLQGFEKKRYYYDGANMFLIDHKGQIFSIK